MKNSSWLNPTLIIIIIMDMALGIGSQLVNIFNPMAFLDFPALEYLSYLQMVLMFFLVAALAVYLYKNEYQAAFYSLLIMYGVVIYNIIRTTFFPLTFEEMMAGERQTIGGGFYIVLVLIHVGCILFSKARENRWLLYYAFSIGVITLLLGNLARFGLTSLVYVLVFCSELIPVFFIFLIRDKEKKNPESSAEILDEVQD